MVVHLGILILLVLTTAIPDLTRQDCEQERRWNGFRGGERFGVNLDAVIPTSVNDSHITVRKIDIHGGGNSSVTFVEGRGLVSIVDEESVTNWPTFVLHVIGAFALACLFAFFPNMFEAQGDKAPTLTPRAFLRNISQALVVILLALIFWMGPEIFDYDRCPIRTWLGSSLLITLAVILLDQCLSNSLLRYLLVPAGCVLLSFATYTLVPSPDHIFKQDSSTNLTVLRVVAAMPLLYAMLSLLIAVVHQRVRSGKRRVILGAISLGASIALLIPTARVVSSGTAPPPPEGNPEGVLWLPTSVGFAVILVSVTLLMALASPTKSSDRTKDIGIQLRNGRYLFAYFSALLILGLLVVAVLAVITNSPYLTYHFPKIEMELSGVGPSLFLFSAALGILIRLVFVEFRFRSSLSANPIAVFSLSILAIGSVVHSNLISREVRYARAIVCFTPEDGRVNWICRGPAATKGQLHILNSAATPTPVVHGERVLAWFGHGGLMCSDLEGNLQWINEEVRYDGIYGVGGSPCILDDKLFFYSGIDKHPELSSINIQNGEIVWQVKLDSPWQITGISRVPVAFGDTLVSWEFSTLKGRDPATGNELWSFDTELRCGDSVSSPVLSDGVLYCSGENGTVAVRLPDSTKATLPSLVWRSRKGHSNCVSPILVNGLLFTVTDNGVLTCLNEGSGEVEWKARLPGKYYASPVSDGRRILFVSLDGQATLIKASDEFEIVSSSNLGCEALASPGIFDDMVAFRSGRRVLLFYDSRRDSGRNSQ